MHGQQQGEASPMLKALRKLLFEIQGSDDQEARVVDFDSMMKELQRDPLLVFGHGAVEMKMPLGVILRHKNEVFDYLTVCGGDTEHPHVHSLKFERASAKDLLEALADRHTHPVYDVDTHAEFVKQFTGNDIKVEKEAEDYINITVDTYVVNLTTGRKMLLKAGSQILAEVLSPDPWVGVAVDDENALQMVMDLSKKGTPLMEQMLQLFSSIRRKP